MPLTPLYGTDPNRPVVLGAFVRDHYGHLGRVTAISSWFGETGLDEEWVQSQSIPITEEQRSQPWVHILCQPGGSVVIPLAGVTVVDPFKFRNPNGVQYFADMVDASTGDAATKAVDRLSATGVTIKHFRLPDFERGPEYFAQVLRIAENLFETLILTHLTGPLARPAGVFGRVELALYATLEEYLADEAEPTLVVDSVIHACYDNDETIEQSLRRLNLHHENRVR